MALVDPACACGERFRWHACDLAAGGGVSHHRGISEIERFKRAPASGGANPRNGLARGAGDRLVPAIVSARGLVNRRRIPCPGALPVSAIAFDCIWTHGHRAWMLGMTRISLAARKISPAVCFAKPLPIVPRVKRGAVPTQQFHLTAAYAIVHRASPSTGFPLRYARRRDCLTKWVRRF
jgi:hypothetical protein